MNGARVLYIVCVRILNRPEKISKAFKKFYHYPLEYLYITALHKNALTIIPIRSFRNECYILGTFIEEPSTRKLHKNRPRETYLKTFNTICSLFHSP